MRELKGVENVSKDYPEWMFLQLDGNDFSCEYSVNILSGMTENANVRNLPGECNITDDDAKEFTLLELKFVRTEMSLVNKKTRIMSMLHFCYQSSGLRHCKRTIISS